MDASQVVLSKEQAELLLPLLPALQKRSSVSNSANDEYKYTVEEMFAKERPGGRSTLAQKYLLVRPFKTADLGT